MKKITAILLGALVIFSACSSSKPYYKTSEGKRKQKYYNGIQFGGNKARGY